MWPLALTAEDAAGMTAMLFASLLVGFLGYRIRVHRDLHLVSGDEPERVADASGVARLVGSVGIGVGILTALYGVAVPFVRPGVAFWGSYVLVVVGAVAVVRQVGRRYATGE